MFRGDDDTKSNRFPQEGDRKKKKHDGATKGGNDEGRAAGPPFVT
jgi:hypothetical protein